MAEKINELSNSEKLKIWGKNQINDALERTSGQLNSGPEILAAIQAIAGTLGILAGTAGAAFVAWKSFQPFWVKQGEIAGLWNKWTKTLDIEGKTYEPGGPYFIPRLIYSPVRIDKTVVTFKIDGETDDTRASKNKTLVPTRSGVTVHTREGAEFDLVGVIPLLVVPNNKTIESLGLAAFTGKSRTNNNVLRDPRVAEAIEIAGMTALQDNARNYSGIRADVPPGGKSDFIEDNLGPLAAAMAAGIRQEVQDVIGEDAGKVVVKGARVTPRASSGTREIQRSDLQARHGHTLAKNLLDSLGGNADLTGIIHTNTTIADAVDSGGRVTIIADTSRGNGGNARATMFAAAENSTADAFEEFREDLAFVKKVRAEIEAARVTSAANSTEPPTP